MNGRPHKRLIAWQKAMALVSRVYEATNEFPRSEEFGLKPQMRRAAVSVPSNIAEGMTRRSNREKLQFLSYARASLGEIDTQTEIALRLEYVSKAEFESLERNLMDVQMLLSGLARSYESR